MFLLQTNRQEKVLSVFYDQIKKTRHKSRQKNLEGQKFLCVINTLYKNLLVAGHESGGEKGLYDHEVCINANHYTPVSESLIPTGEVAPVASKPIFDLRIPKRLGDMLPKCPGGENNGYDHNFCVNDNFVKSQDHHDMRYRFLYLSRNSIN